MEKKYWEIIIENSNKKQTLPYILGSKRILFPNSDIDTVESLLNEIISSENNEIYSMYFCPDIREYVIFHNKYKDYLIKGLEIRNPKTGNLKLVFGMNMEILGKTFENVKLKLTEKYKLNIAEKKFSYEKGDWKLFTEKDINTILSLKNQ
ncbi:MAG: hypothetical protein KDC67_06430 [Ignavibacteriae bacterium]|nr:hypothetical protein [Ignavibacteriota bacterium]